MSVEAKDRSPNTEGADSSKYKRTENPLVTGLSAEPESITRFTQTTNKFLAALSLPEIEQPHLEDVSIFGRGAYAIIVEVPFSKNDAQKVASLKNLMRIFYGKGEVAEKFTFQLPYDRSSKIAHRITQPQTVHIIAPSIGSGTIKPQALEGFHLKGKKEAPLLGVAQTQRHSRHKLTPQEGSLGIHNISSLTEAELAAQTIFASMIMSGKLNISTDETLQENKDKMRAIFIVIYKYMLRDLMPQIEEDEMFGLSDQIEDMITNSFKPLSIENGVPMHSLAIGAPGLGKSLSARFLAFSQEAVVVRINVSTFLEEFEKRSLGTLSKLKKNLDLPIVLLVDDLEAIFVQGRSIDSQGGQHQSVDQEKRAKFLTLLERLIDTHAIPIVGTMNHPDIELAFLRRFNLVYFPLPSSEVRLTVLENILEGNIPEDADGKLIAEIAAKTEGFNYDGLLMIPHYLINIISANGNKPDDLKAYKRMLLAAVAKAKVRCNTAELKRLDDAAKIMVGRKRDTFGLGSFT